MSESGIQITLNTVNVFIVSFSLKLLLLKLSDTRFSERDENMSSAESIQSLLTQSAFELNNITTHTWSATSCRYVLACKLINPSDGFPG